MPRFFVEGRPQGEVLLGGEDGRHIVRSLRMRPGEALTLCDGQGTDYACTFVSAQGESALVRVEEAFPNRTEPRAQVTVCQCLAKGDKLETVTQKAVELGAAALWPVESARCVVRLDRKGAQKKTARLQKIAREAAMQSGRGIIPAVEEPRPLKQALEEAARQGEILFFYERGQESLKQALQTAGGGCSSLWGRRGALPPRKRLWPSLWGPSSSPWGPASSARRPRPWPPWPPSSTSGATWSGEDFYQQGGKAVKNALVTGASGGIGRAVAKELARRGWRVALHYHANEAAAKSLEEAICREGGFARAYPADLTQEAQVEALFGAVERDLGFVEGLVNSAGVAWKGLFTDMTLADWRWVVDGDLTSVFLCCRRALPAMIREKRGSIVNVSSMWGEVGASCEAAYSAAKAGVIGLTKALAKEEGPSGIRVNCLSPGVIDTPMNGDLTEADLAALREETPLGRTGTPEETAQAAAFLLEQEFITGQVLGVSGGMVV